MIDKVRIRGGNRLKGTTPIVPNKNAILAALPAAILTDHPVTYRNVPQSPDVLKLLELMKRLGASIDDSDFSALEIDCSSVENYEVDPEIGAEFRASIMLAGPLLARFGKVRVPLPGGCTLGARSIASHLDNFAKVGIVSRMDGDAVWMEVADTSVENAVIWLDEASVTATENLFMYLAGSGVGTVVTGAACEPHVVQLTQLLMGMGAVVRGCGSNKVAFENSVGVGLGAAEFIPEPDFVDIGGFVVAAAVTKSKLRLVGANQFHIVGGLMSVFRKFGVLFEEAGEDLIVDGAVDLVLDPETCGLPLAGPDLPKLSPRPWPGFPVDVFPVMATLASKTRGQLLIQNWMYENGLEFVNTLNDLGADIELLDSQKAVVKGPVSFTGGCVTPPSVIQASKAVFLAALADDVVTEISGVGILRRRYPDIFEVYGDLGADIEILE
jgi:UDP-N-acetylglucosamine 1-carboxyvinyltransferase